MHFSTHFNALYFSHKQKQKTTADNDNKKKPA